MSRAGRVARTAGTGTRDLAKTVRSGGPASRVSTRAATRSRSPRAVPPSRLRQRCWPGSPTPGEADRGGRRSRHGSGQTRNRGPGRSPTRSAADGRSRGPGWRRGRPRRRPEVARTPMGNRRAAVTESDELDYKLPAGQAAPAREGGPRPRLPRPRAGRQGAARGARPLRRRGRAPGRRQRPAREPLRAAARARHQGVEGGPA